MTTKVRSQANVRECVTSLNLETFSYYDIDGGTLQVANDNSGIEERLAHCIWSLENQIKVQKRVIARWNAWQIQFDNKTSAHKWMVANCKLQKSNARDMIMWLQLKLGASDA